MSQHAPPLFMTQQTDAVITQVNPVSAALYTIIPATRNVRILALQTNVTWLVTQPTPLEIVMTIDGVAWIHGMVNPISGTPYFLREDLTGTPAFQLLNATFRDRSFWMEGKSVKVEARITWAVTQPTPLVARVRWAKES